MTAVLANDGERRDRIREPAVADLRRQLHGLALLRRHPDRRRPEGLRAQRDGGGPEVPALVGHRWLRPEPANERSTLAQQCGTVAQRTPEGRELLRAVALPDAQDDAATGNDVEDRTVLRHVDGVVEREEQDPGPELDA